MTFEMIKQIFILILFVAGFFLLIASPIIYINYKQKKYFKQLSKKFNLELHAKKLPIIRDFPYVDGVIDNRTVYIEASAIGEFRFDTHYETQTYASPSIRASVSINNKKIQGFLLNQTKEIPNDSKITPSDFNSYFNLVIIQDDKDSIIFRNDIKQKIIDCAKGSSLLNIGIQKGYLVSYSIFELTTLKKYNEIEKKLSLMLEIAKIID